MQELFSNELLSAYLGRFKINLEREIESAKPEYLLNIEEEAYSNFLVSKYTVSRPILKEQYIDKEELERTSRPTVYNPSMFSGDLVVTISIPFEGERHLFKCRPLGYKKNPIAPPIGNITGSEIKLSYIVTRSDAKSIKEKYTQDINKIHKYLQWIKED